MITGFKWKKKDIKQAITEPKFGKIFIKRFLIWLGVFAIAALIVFQRAGDYVVELRTRTLNYARTHIAEVVKDLYETDPESEDYSCKVSSLKASLAYYQRMGKNYAEVQIGDKKYATDADTACTSLFMGDRDYYEKLYPERDLKEGAMVTRYAPSPTGFVHLGNLLSAFADMMYAKQTGGSFFLRVEDTDQKRMVEGGIENPVAESE